MEDSERAFLESYDGRAFERPSVTADALLFTIEGGALRLALVRRENPPFQGRWALPGTFVGMEETAEAAAARALREKAGIEGVYMEQLYTFSEVARDPRMRVISVTYLAMAAKARLGGLRGATLFEARLDGEALTLISPSGEALPEAALAFDHAGIVRTALRRMAGKLEYTEIGFEFLEDKGRFTLPELCEIYTAVGARAYDFANFRRFIKKRYEENGRIAPTQQRLKKRGAPAVVYRWADGEDPTTTCEEA